LQQPASMTIIRSNCHLVQVDTYAESIKGVVCGGIDGKDHSLIAVAAKASWREISSLATIG